MKIHDELWYVLTDRKNGSENLAYMTQVETPSLFNSKIRTGCMWANKDISETSGTRIKNDPTTGFYIGSSVSRWSTSNKLFRVVDPRGFTVEVPTDNIATLLHLTTVVNGVIQGECVWGRDGSNHILLPTNSEPFKEAKRNSVKQTDYVSVKNLKIGDMCTISYGGETLDVQYVGRENEFYLVIDEYNLDWDLWLKDLIGHKHRSTIWDSPKRLDVASTKFLDMFGKNYFFNHKGQLIYIAKPKIISINGNGQMKEFERFSRYNLRKLYPNIYNHTQRKELPLKHREIMERTYPHMASHMPIDNSYEIKIQRKPDL